jgi:hypothetical protein
MREAIHDGGATPGRLKIKMHCRLVPDFFGEWAMHQEMKKVLRGSFAK